MIAIRTTDLKNFTWYQRLVHWDLLGEWKLVKRNIKQLVHSPYKYSYRYISC